MKIDTTFLRTRKKKGGAMLSAMNQIIKVTETPTCDERTVETTQRTFYLQIGYCIRSSSERYADCQGRGRG